VEADPEWTVLTVAVNGAWGVSTARRQTEAIAGAVRRCQMRSTDPSDCGAELIAYRTGWALAILCGHHRILVSDGDREEVEAAAYERIAALKQASASSLPRCRRVLTVDPVGTVTTVREPNG
ncbi:MAG: hypothetical protein ACREUF_11370, partial [Solimonas sp.]